MTQRASHRANANLGGGDTYIEPGGPTPPKTQPPAQAPNTPNDWDAALGELIAEETASV
jgi:hypothetical protein